MESKRKNEISCNKEVATNRFLEYILAPLINKLEAEEICSLGFA